MVGLCVVGWRCGIMRGGMCVDGGMDGIVCAVGWRCRVGLCVRWDGGAWRDCVKREEIMRRGGYVRKWGGNNNNNKKVILDMSGGFSRA